jgi:hypothetical protein
MRWVGHVALKVKLKNAYKLLVGKTDWKMPLGKPRRRWEDNIRMDLREIGWEIVNRIHLVQDRDQ